MQVSFVIPLYNCLSLTQAMLASLRPSLPRDLDHEIILVDDGSTDGTGTWLEDPGFPCRVLRHAENLGYAAANNHGAALARGELLVLLNNDLVLRRGWLEPMLAVHRRLGDRAGAVGNIQIDARTGQLDHAGVFINLKGKAEHERSLPFSWSRLVRGWHEAVAVTGACLLIERRLWEEVGGFDEAFHNGGEDVDLCLRLRARGRTNAVADRSTIRHHVSASPGRTRRNEENSRRLALRWRRELVACAARRWCRRYFELPPLDAPPGFAPGLWLHAIGLRREPPAAALARMETLIDAAFEVEFRRWDRILGG